MNKILTSTKTLMSTLAMTVLSATAYAAPATVPATVNRASISTEAAVQVAQNAVNQCKKDGYSVSATVVDVSGTPLVQLRDTDAGPHTLNSSYRKAFTAVSLKKPTETYADMVAKNPKLDALRDMDDRILLLGGGLPIVVNNTIVGAVGVGGAPGAHLDVICAQAGTSIFNK